MKQIILKGKTSVTLYVKVRNSSSGAPLTGLAFNTASLVAYYVRPLGSATAITLATQTVTGAYSSGGFVEVSSANMPGVYRFDPPDAVFATGVDSAVMVLKGAANMEQVDVEIQLTDVNLQDAVRAGLTALPNAAAAAAGGLFTRGTGAGQINQDANGRIDVNIAAVSTDATAADNLEAMFDGTGYNASASNIGTVGTVNALANNVITAAALAADAGTEIAAAVGALVVEVEDSYTLKQVLSLLAAYAFGRTADGGVTFKTRNNAATRITGTVNGSNERTAVTVTPSA